MNGTNGKPPLRIASRPAEEEFFELPPDPPDDRPEVRINNQRIHETVDVVCAHLHLDDELYVRGKELVTIVGALPPEPGERAPAAESTPLIFPIPRETLVERISRHMHLVKWKPPTKKKPGEWVTANASGPITGAVMARRQWPLRHLVSVTETPIMRPDGTLIQEPGYDKVTGYVYRPSCAYPRVPDAPTREDAAKALEELKEVFVDFPYADESSRMVPIAAALTLLVRSAIVGACPAFGLDATLRGSGKTLQADAVAALALGRSAARKSYPPEDEELGKVLAAYAIAGARLILFDNVTREFGGGEIDQCLTARDTVEIRILGKTEVRVLPWNAVIMCSGNNLTLGEDTVRRILLARLESPIENPEDRTEFKHPHLYDWVIENRPRLVVAALTIVRAYARLGFHRNEDKAWGSFEAWSRLIPGAIVYAGGANPMLARPSIEDHASDATRALLPILDLLPRLVPPGKQGISTKDIIAALYSSDRDDRERAEDGFEDMRDAIAALTSPKPGQKPDVQRLGLAMKARLGSPRGGKKLVRFVTEDSRKTVLWNVTRT